MSCSSAALSVVLAVGFASLVACGSGAEDDASSSAAAEALIGGRTGAVYTMSNDPAGNQVIVFRRSNDGSLQEAARYATTGKGSGDALASQGAVTLTSDRHWLFVVNPGSSELSVFAVSGESLYLVDTQPTGGTRPVSVAVSHGFAYILHAGAGANGISGFAVAPNGKLKHLADSTMALSGADVGPAQIGFSVNGYDLFVTEKGTNLIDEFAIDLGSGLPYKHLTHPSNGQTPYGFAVTPDDHLVVSEAFGGAAGASAVSSYKIDSGHALATVSKSSADRQSAACWIALANDGHVAFTSNTASGTVSAYRVSGSGALSLLTPDGISLTTGDGSSPTDMAVTADDRFLYVVDSAEGHLSAARISSDGTLHALADVTGLPATLTGLAAL